MTSRPNSSSIVIALCCVVVTGLAIKRELSPPAARSQALAPEKTKDWERYSEGRNRLGHPSAPVTIVEFSDFQCPFCKRLHDVLGEIRAAYPTEVATVYRHFPLERIHPHARTAALASECAAGVGRFHEFADALFARQDSIGILPWTAFGLSAGISDTAAFKTCIRDSVHVETVKVDQDAGRDLKATGTPTILVNQWRIRGGAKETLVKLIEDELKKR